MAKIVVIGAGAAGCFCAIEIKRAHPECAVLVLESSKRPMAKLALTGGGRCNLTNSFRKVERLSQVYPRGEQLMKRALSRFDHEDLMDWFEREGVRLLVQEDECVFPVSQDAMQIVRTLERLMRINSVELRCESRVNRIQHTGQGYELLLGDGSIMQADKIVLTAGGCSRGSLQALLPEDIEITPTVPSLFTFKIADESLRSLMGAVMPYASLSLAGTSFRSSGALLLTDWGVSGPATLRLSSYAARHLAENNYQATLLINWTAATEASVREFLDRATENYPRKQLSSIHPDGLSERVWRHILRRAGVKEDTRWAEFGSKGRNKLAATLMSDSYEIKGRAAFKEEFVTCGGVALSEINLKTLESKKHSGLYFAGEVLDVDAVTGGFNLQAAWSMAKVVSDAIL